MGKMKKGIAVAGSLIADTFYEIDTYPKQGMLTNIRDTVKNIGGTGNMILDLAKLDAGLPVKVSAVIGSDENGKMLRERLSVYPNIDQSNLTEEGSSSETLVMNARDTKQRTFFYHPAASDIFDESYIDWDKTDADIFHLEYLLSMAKVDAAEEPFGTHGARILHEAKRRGMKTSIDMVSEQSERAQRIVTCALKYTDYCSINEVEAEAATGIEIIKGGRVDEEMIKTALLKLHELGVSTWAVIHSPVCSYGYDCMQEEYIRVPSLKLPPGYIKGTNGAGDAYCSGILYGAYRHDSLAEAMRLAAACAVCSLSAVNGTDGMRSYRDVKEEEKRLSQ